MTSTDGQSPAYRAVPAHVDLPQLEREIIKLWDEQGTFEATLKATEGAPRWTFYEGPPTANGIPGTHHVEARVFKDVFPRFKTMQGLHVERKAGWDCHGLPVEIAVEKELGFNGKPDIEAYGIAEFNAKCREAVLRNVDLFAEMTDRMGYWVDMSDPYRTMDASYVESVWWGLTQIFDQGLLVEDFRVAPYCPRCGTTLSDHELAQGYETITDPSIYVRFPLTSGPYAEKASLLIWTTTPWTLVSNALVAAKDDVTYVTATNGTETIVVAEPLVEAALGDGWTVQDRFAGADMVGWTYQRPFDIVDWPERVEGPPAPEAFHGSVPRAHYVVTEDYVTTTDGTGLVHQSPAFGEDDFASVRRNGIAMVKPIDEAGHFEQGLDIVGGAFFRDANDALLTDLTQRDLLFHQLPYEHSYPHCWRCHTPLMYYALPAWYIRTTAKKDDLLAQNEATDWFPNTIKHGRYGDWLNNNIDWALSRNRYWGTPLPIWRNDEDPTRLVCVDSLARLSELTGRDLSDLDPHRPFIDEITFEIDGEPGTYRRVPEVIDAWFDSGAMPFAQWGYPHAPGSAEKFERAYPAQYICEAIDQTRGWFYSLMAVGTLVFERSSYESVVCLGHILAEDGRKMSKHLGNILLPMPLMDEHGADALRWFMACSGSPWSARRIGHTALSEIVRKVLLTYWNTVAFQSLYARAADFVPGETPAPPVEERTVLDRWALSEAHRLALAVEVGAGGVRHPARRTVAGGLCRRPLQLVRPPLPPPLLEGRSGGPGDAARVPVRRDVADGADHPVHHRTGVAGPVPPDLTRASRFRPSGPLAAVRPGRSRRFPARPDGDRPATRRAGPRGPGRERGQDPAAAASRAGQLGRLVRARRRAPGPGVRGAQHRRARVRRRCRLRSGRPHRQGQLPQPRQTLRYGNPEGRGRHRGCRRCGPGRITQRRRRDQGRGRRLGHRAGPRRRDHLRATARGLVGRERPGRDGGTRPRARRRAAACRPGPRDRPGRSRSTQGVRPGDHRPHQSALDRGRRRLGRPERAW